MSVAKKKYWLIKRVIKYMPKEDWKISYRNIINIYEDESYDIANHKSENCYKVNYSTKAECYRDIDYMINSI